MNTFFNKLNSYSFQAKTPSNLKLGKDVELNGPEDCESFMKARQLVRPDDQLELTDAELNEEVPKVLTTSQNQNAVKNLVVYSFKDGCFVNVPPPGTTVTLFSVEGTALHIDSEEAKHQMTQCREEGELSD